jgi:uncharacterized membrane protein (UPF0182 family)
LPFVLIVAALIVAIVIYTNVWTNRLWFSSIGYTAVYTKLLLTQLGLFFSFGLLMAVVVAANIALAHRLRPRGRRGQTNPALERYRQVLESRLTIVMVVLAGIAGLFGGGISVGKTQTFLAWQHATPFGTKDPKFGIDIGFWIFSYPWWRYLFAFVFTTLILSAIAALAVHYIMGAIRFSAPRRGGTSAAQIHLSILIGLAILLRGIQYWFDRYGLELNEGSRFTGLRYATDHATMNAKTILAVLAAICAALFFANAVLRRWLIPTIGLVLLVLSSIVLGLIYPAIVQAASVNPNEIDKERPYAKRNIHATRKAFDVDDVKVSKYDAKTSASAGQLKKDASVLPSIRLMDPSRIGEAFDQLQQVKGYYQFPDILNVDRYKLPGDKRNSDTVVAARGLDLNNVQNPSWNLLHTVYTHGYGLVAAYGSRAAPDGSPDWIEKDLPPKGKLNEKQSRIYFGELMKTYSIVGSRPHGKPLELDTPTGGKNNGPKYNTYHGGGGVQLNSWRRFLYGLKYFNFNLVLSERAHGKNAQIIYDRRPKQRVEKAAPWLTVDRNAYPAVVDGRVKWIVDAYTTADSYPNSQRISLQNATSDTKSRIGTIGNQPSTQINYMRNSVKAVVDAYTGKVTLYAWNDQDPVLQTWRKVFPGVVKPKSAIGSDLMKHLRYPQDYYKVQRQILAKYHVTNASDWISNNDQWAIPDDPTEKHKGTKEPPYYLTVRMPGQKTGRFSLTSVYVPNGRSNIAAYTAVNSDPGSKDYGQIQILKVPAKTQIDGPGQAFNAMTTNSRVAEALRPFRNKGTAKVTYGNLLTLPLGGGLIYVQPVYTQRKGSGGGQYPVLRYVMVRFGNHVGIGSSLQQALDQVFQGHPGASTGEKSKSGNAKPAPSGKANNPAAQAELEKAKKSFAAADKALKKGDLGTYQKKNQAAIKEVNRALKQLGG